MKKKIEIFDVINYIILTLVTLVMLYPFLNIIAVSFSSYTAYILNPLRIWPKGFNVEAYKIMLQHPRLYTSYLNTIIITVSGVITSMFLYIITAYPLSKKHLKGRKAFVMIIVFTMMFNGGLIPNYYLMRSLGLINTLSALVLASVFSGFNVILMKNFFEGIPESLEEAAKIDGANDLYVLFRIVVPLSKPIIATLSLFVAVGYWNNFFNAVVYTTRQDKWTLMLFLREIIMGAKMQSMSLGSNSVEMNTDVPTVILQYATLLVVMVPILMAYPFLQKYFVKGIMVGSVKG